LITEKFMIAFWREYGDTGAIEAESTPHYTETTYDYKNLGDSKL